MTHHQRFVVAEIPVCQTEHQPVAQRVELLPGARLRNAAAAGRGERGHVTNCDRSAEGGIGRRRKVGVETSKRMFYTLTADKTVDSPRITRAFAFLIEHLEDEGILELEDIDDLLFYAVS